MKTAIKMTSSFTNQKICIDIEEVSVVESVEGSREVGQAKTKVYTRTKGNFYVLESADKVSKACFKAELDVEGL